jgi:quaternary ammonium compound-resistance protein SugE
MAWVILLISGVLEAVWATALGKSEGFTKLWPSVVFGVALLASMAGLAWAMRDISTGTAYAVWVGIGAALTVIWAMITGETDVSWVKLALIAGLVGCVVGLKLVDGTGH